PAALCGIVGLKTTIGAVSTEGVAPLSPTLDTVGPMTRYVDDARLIFGALRSTTEASGRNGREAVRARRVGRDALEPLDEQVWSAYEDALERIAWLGLEVAPVTLPRSFADYQRDSGMIMAYEAYAALHRLVDDPATPLDPFVRARVMQGATISDEAMAAIRRERDAAIEAFGTVLPRGEILVLPTTPYPARPLAEVDESTFPMSRFTRIANHLDLCGLSIPCGRAGNGMPIGLQLIAAGGAEHMLLTFAERLEECADAA
ncbi:amidase, partial [Nitratireductor sp. GCM10026969]|uniref:amidase n=1 Tax=Nitratireductor sp. GCM10026969 TaxID=3252645 RepID=UPI003616C2BF